MEFNAFDTIYEAAQQAVRKKYSIVMGTASKSEPESQEAPAREASDEKSSNPDR